MFRFLRSTALWILLLPYASIFLGAASNQLVLNANGDTFPVRVNAVKVHKYASEDAALGPDGTIYLDDTHVVMTSQTHLNWMADILDFHDGTYSVGDLLVEFGGWLQTFSIYVWIAVVCGRLRREYDGI